MNKLKKDIYDLVIDIPKGKVMTYGQIARILELKDVRLVGWMLHQNRDLNTPCHRVIKSDGSVAKGYAFGGPHKQRKLLEKEGVRFKKGNVDLVKYLLNLGPS